MSVIKILDGFKCSWTDVLPISVNDNNEFEFKSDTSSQIFSFRRYLNLSDEASANECMQKLIDKYKCHDFNPKEQRDIVSVRYNISKTNGNSAAMPYILADNISKEAMLVLSEVSTDVKGIRVETSLVRKYLNGSLAPHIIGYTGAISSEEYEKRKENYSISDKIGKSGIEGAMEDYLRGKSGRRMIQMAKSGAVVDMSEQENAYPGNTIYLTLDSKLQEIANNSLKENVEKARSMGVEDCRSGAAVALNVRDFSILAAATYPSYDLNEFLENPAYYPELANDKENQPLLNRAFNGAFAPGSIYKPLSACAALQENLLTEDDTIRCDGGFRYYKGYTLKCMGVHGNAKLRYALAKSCNVFFAELGRRLGIDLIDNYAKRFGIGVKTGVEIYESSGVLAGPEHSKKVGGRWYESGASQAAIGQSDNMFTPLQLATYTATIANGGHRYKTHIVKKITNYNKNEVVIEKGKELVCETGVSEENLNIVKDGMRQVVLAGTATDFSRYPIALAAKTGTAQNAGTDHTTFICFGPYENPEIAICVVIANGKYGALSKNVARDMLDYYFKTEKNN